MHHRTTIPVDDARAVVVALLASGRVPPLQATLFDIESLAECPFCIGSGARLVDATRSST